MYSLAEARPAEGTWVFWTAVEQCNGRISSGLSRWRAKDYDNLTAEGLTSFWTEATNVANAHLVGRLVEIGQQLEENADQRIELQALKDDIQLQAEESQGAQ